MSGGSTVGVTSKGCFKTQNVEHTLDGMPESEKTNRSTGQTDIGNAKNAILIGEDGMRSSSTV